MKKFINSIDTLLDESLLGFAKAHADIIQLNTQPHFVKRINPSQARQGRANFRRRFRA